MKGVYLFGYVKTKDDVLIRSADAIRNSSLSLCKSLGLKIVGENYHKFKEPNGITYCFILSQSHFVVHTWPEDGKIFFDLFTCNKYLDEKKIVNALSKEFKGIVKVLKRLDYKWKVPNIFPAIILLFF